MRTRHFLWMGMLAFCGMMAMASLTACGGSDDDDEEDLRGPEAPEQPSEPQRPDNGGGSNNNTNKTLQSVTVAYKASGTSSALTKVAKDLKVLYVDGSGEVQQSSFSGSFSKSVTLRSIGQQFECGVAVVGTPKDGKELQGQGTVNLKVTTTATCTLNWSDGTTTTENLNGLVSNIGSVNLNNQSSTESFLSIVKSSVDKYGVLLFNGVHMTYTVSSGSKSTSNDIWANSGR